MPSRILASRDWIRSVALVVTVLVTGVALAAWKSAAARAASAAAARQPEPIESVNIAVAIPVSALRKGPGGDHVFLIAPDSAGRTRAHLQPVRSGPVLDDDVVILSGLTPGQRVATSGSFKLR